MGTIVTREVNDAGPYAYRVEAVGTKDNGNPEQDWDYLGPVGRLDPEAPANGDPLTDDEIAQLRAEGFGLAEYRDTTEANFAQIDVANATRDELVDRFGEDVLAVTDDRRSLKVELAEDAPEAAKTIAAGHASDNRAETEAGSGQEPLTKGERDRIDFRESNVPHAMSAKAIILDEGISDWEALYDPRLSPEEHRELAERNRRSMQGKRLDNADGEETMGMTAEQAMDEQERRAREACIAGHEEACEYLREVGWSEQEIDDLEAYSDPEEFARCVCDETRRAAA